MSAEESVCAARATESSLPVILSVAFPYAPVGTTAVGGAEVICSHIEAALPSLEYRSVVVANADSDPAGRLYGTQVPAETITEALRQSVESEHQANIDRALAAYPVALVHMHGLDFHKYRVPEHIPVLVTLHLPPSWYPDAIWSLPANYHLVCVSEHQRRACPEVVRDCLGVVDNGVPLPSASMLRTEGRYALMLARICPEKNLHTGLDAARRAGIPALLGGEVFAYAEHQRYFAEEIEPRLTTLGNDHEGRSQDNVERPVARFLGRVSAAEKDRVLSRAACLLLPSLAPETSSLAAMEALAAGVPVLGMRVGAVPDIVEHGRTGFLVEPGDRAVGDLADAIRRLPELDRQICRTVAEQRFSIARMLDGYRLLYARFARIAARSLPVSSSESSAARSGSERNEDRPSPLELQDISLHEVRNGEEMVGLEEEWTALWSVDSGASPFQHPAWLIPWWRQFGCDGELHAIAFRKGTTRELLGFVPLYTYAHPDRGERQLLLVGAGTTDYLEAVWAPGTEVLGEKIWDFVGALPCWDVVSFQQLRPGSLLLMAAERRGLAIELAEPCSTIDLAADLPARVRANARRYRRRAEIQGPLTCALASSAEEALLWFEVLAELHSRRWEGRGEAGVLHDPRVLAHHRESVPLLLKADLLRMFHLRLSGQTLGVLYGLADPPHARERRLHLYLIGFDERYASVSPGTLLLLEAYQYAREHGFAKLDLLRGGEEYKQLWGAVPQATRAVHFRRPADTPVQKHQDVSSA